MAIDPMAGGSRGQIPGLACRSPRSLACTIWCVTVCRSEPGRRRSPPDAGNPPGTALPGILRDGRLGDHDPVELTDRFGTPLFAYDLAVVGEQVAALRAVVPPPFDVAYAVKANPNLAILHHLARLGMGADVASGGELRHALRAGFPPEQVIITGPGKLDGELASAVDAGVRAVTVESLGELRRLAGIAEARRRRQPILLRAVVDDVAILGGGRFMGGMGSDKFGMGADDLRRAAEESVASAWVEPIGLHAFGASNVLDAAVLADHVDATVDAARALAAAVGFSLRLIDVGGGLGIPYQPEETPLDLAALGERLDRVAARLATEEITRETRVLLEPGRFLVASSGAYVARVVDRKRHDGRTVAIVDGGIHHVLRSVLVGQENRVRLLTGAGDRDDTALEAGRNPVMIAGPLCTGLDVFAQAADTPLPEPGDLVAVLDVGAYGATESMPHFLSHPIPPEIALLDGEAWVSRPRVEPEAWLAQQAGEPPVAAPGPGPAGATT